MWISRAHFDLIKERTKEFREWHESQIAERDTIIARQETRILALDEERKQLTADLTASLKARFEPVAQTATNDDPNMPDWMKPIRDQIDEVKGDAKS